MAILSLSTAISSIPPTTRGFIALTVLFTLIYNWLHWHLAWEYNPYLTLVPGSCLFNPWTLLTAGFVETSIIGFIVSIALVPAAFRYLERLWGSMETLKFILVCVIIPNFIAAVFNWLEFAATKNVVFLYNMQYSGQSALHIAVLVAFTQLIPEHRVQILGVLKARVKTFPMIYLTFSTVMTIIGFQCPFILIQFGWFVSWMYLRFYKKNAVDLAGGSTSYGDRSETFSFVNWFPPLLHYPLSLLSNATHSLASRLHIIPTVSPDMESGAYSQLPGSARAEAERRRAMALKALDNRVATSSPSSLTPASSSQTQLPRPPPAAVAPRSDGPASHPSPSITTRPSERKKSVSEPSVEDTDGQ